jgi:hypothetical protein
MPNSLLIDTIDAADPARAGGAAPTDEGVAQRGHRPEAKEEQDKAGDQ